MKLAVIVMLIAAVPTLGQSPPRTSGQPVNIDFDEVHIRSFRGGSMASIVGLKNRKPRKRSPALYRRDRKFARENLQTLNDMGFE